MSIPGKRLLAMFAGRQVRKHVFDTNFPERTYMDWNRALQSNERAAFEEKLPGKVGAMMDVLARGATNFILRDSISDAVELETRLRLPDSDTLISKRLAKLQALRARLRQQPHAAIQMLEQPNNPYFGFFTDQELDKLRAEFDGPLSAQHEQEVREECWILIRDRVSNLPTRR